MVYASSFAVAASFIAAASAQGTGQGRPLVSWRIPHADIPYQVDTAGGIRGPQAGYNRCNETTLGQESLCQTAYVNSIDDFCLWGAQEPDSIVGDIEGEMIAFCTKPVHGTRVMPPGTITGVQFIRTPDYVQVTGRMEQTNLNIQEGDYGGEMDSAGADQRGNPIGSLTYTDQFQFNSSEGYQQVIHWHNFMGSNMFCYKACRADAENASRMCEHIYDRIGCMYNAPANYEEGVFESCLGDNQDPPGIYTGANGQVSTYQQPPESLGVITSIPYTVRIPATSSCTPFQSAELFAEAAQFLGGSGVVSSAASAASSGASQAGPTSSGAIQTNAPSSAILIASSQARSTSAPPSGGASSAHAVGLVATLALAGVAGLAMAL